EHLQVSTPVLVLPPNVSTVDVSEEQLSVEAVPIEIISDVVKCSGHKYLERKPSEMTTNGASSTITPSGKCIGKILKSV
ncbi:hypothetical protein NE477_25825, partial [Blautia marasmi]|uniref:hypothetical protein n=1 Tax=Blautia marasmi TaxID=1917868 RepID=UPI00210A97E0